MTSRGVRPANSATCLDQVNDRRANLDRLRDIDDALQGLDDFERRCHTESLPHRPEADTRAARLAYLTHIWLSSGPSIGLL